MGAPSKPRGEPQSVNTGLIFKAKEKKTANHPDGDGFAAIKCPHCERETAWWISAWRKVSKKSGEPFTSLAFKPRFMDAQAPTGAPVRTPDKFEPDDSPPF